MTPSDLSSNSATKVGATAQRRQVATVLASQAFATGSNGLAALLAARASQASEYGSIAVLLAIYVTVVQLVRPFAGSVLQVSLHGADAASGRALARGSVIVAAAVASAFTIIGVGVGVGLFQGPQKPMLLVSVTLIPLLVVHDTLRVWAISAQRPDRALQLDVAWLVGFVTGASVLHLTSDPSGAEIMLAWAVSGAGVAFIAWVVTAISADRSVDLATARRSARRIGAVYFVEASLAVVTVAGYLVLLRLVTDSAAVGRLSVLEMPFGLLSMANQGLGLYLQPATRRLASNGRSRRAWRLSLACTGLMVLATLALAALIVALPEDVLRDLVGPSFQDDGWLLAGVVAKFVVIALVLTSSTMARALGARRETLGFGAAITVVAAVVGLAVAPVSLATSYLIQYAILALGTFEILRRIRDRPYREDTV